MKYSILATEPFERKLKKLARKFPSLKTDLAALFEQLENDPFTGQPIGKHCFKIRVAISSKGKGKSGGARLITYVRVTGLTVFLIDIYDKSDQSTISDKELKLLISLLGH